MSKLLHLLKSPWTIALIGIGLLSILVWVAGPYLAFAGREPFAGAVARLLVIVLMVAVWGTCLLVAILRERSKSKRIGGEIAAQEGGAEDADAAGHERALLESRFREAVKMLRKRRGAGSLYKLPWYMVIGPPGSGKSTLVRNSGLQFPLAGEFGKQSLRGVGGTRNCDWWFTDEAVFLDTAGRYTTQDSDRQADAGAWTDFLRLLRRHRRRQPVNGVLVTMSVSDLLLLDDAERDRHVQAVRRRLDELSEQLQINVPVYLVFTKCDLVAGFTEFFEDLNPEQRRQVWGVSFPVDRTMDGSAARVLGEEFALLLNQLSARLVDRLHSERDRGRRAAILSFPQQFAAVGETARQFAEEVFAGHAYGPPPLLRGVYFTSGTQEGTPIDRMMGAVARTFGLEDAQVQGHDAQNRTFFVERLLGDVVFAESGFAGSNPAAERRKAWLQAAACGGIALATLLLLAGMGGSYVRNAAYLADVQAALDDQPAAEDPSQAQTREQFFARALQRLEGLRPAVDTARRHDERVPWSMRMGLYQGRAVGGQLHDAYLRELNGVLLPGLAAQFRRGLGQHAGDLQALYYYLKGYLMLGQPERLDADELRTLADIEWRRLFSSEPVLQEALASHLQALVADPERVRPLSLDEAQVEQARNTLRSADLSDLVYSSLRLGLESGGAEPLVLEKELGLLGDVFRRASGTPMSEPLPALYTQPVFAAQVDGGIAQGVERFLADDWVFGAERGDALSTARVEQRVLALYEQDYIRAWDALLDDLALQPATDLQQASMIAAKLSGSGSPLRLLLRTVRANTADMLRAPEGGEDGESTGDQALAAAADAATRRASSRSAALSAVLAGGQDEPERQEPGESISEHFAQINLMTEGAPGAMPLDRTLGVIEQLGMTLLTMTEFEAGKANPQLLIAQQEAEQLPQPVSRWVASLTGKSEALVATGASSALGEQAREAVGPDCAEFIRGRYPFDPSSQAEIPLQNFGELFGSGGRFDTLYKQSLEKLLDTGGSRWRWRSGPGAVAGPPGLPAQMQAAHRIKQNYFRDGNMPDVRFTLSVRQFGPDVVRVVVDVDGQEAQFRPGRDVSVPMRWPGPTPGRASLVAYDATGTPIERVSHSGEWALFRMLHAGGLQRESDLRHVARFSAGGGTVEIALQAASLRHPFLDTGVQRFRCVG